MNKILFKNPVQRVAAIHDLSSIGKSSLTVVIPVLSAMGMTVCPIPTAILSAITTYDDLYFEDLTASMDKIIDHFKRLDLELDAIYSGFLGSIEQTEKVIDLINFYQKKDKKPLVVVDPVLGDDGKLYATFDEKMISNMANLIKFADIITPNITEATLLLDKEFKTELSLAEIKDWALSLANRGPSIVIITSVPDSNNPLFTSVIAYNKKSNTFWKVSCKYLPANYPGTGDCFTSIVLGSLLKGESLPIAIDRAVWFLSLAIRSTFGHKNDSREGFFLEKVLQNINSPVQVLSYELI